MGAWKICLVLARSKYELDFGRLRLEERSDNRVGIRKSQNRLSIVYLGVEAVDLESSSLLQNRLNELNTSIKVSLVSGVRGQNIRPE